MIELKPLSISNLNSFYHWINDEDVIRYSLSLFQRINSKEEIDKWFKSLLANTKEINLGIYFNGIFIGYAGICNISEFNRSGEYFIFIGDKNQWGKGLGTEVTKKILNIGFEERMLNRIMLTASDPNIGGIKAYQKAGFKIEGKLKQACFRDGKYHDKLIMAILEEDWE